jgi:hypothetical protein
MNDLTCDNYSDKAFVVRGETKIYKEGLKELGGKYNDHLRDGPGWIFPKFKQESILKSLYTLNKDFESKVSTGTKPVSLLVTKPTKPTKPVSLHTSGPDLKRLESKIDTLTSLVKRVINMIEEEEEEEEEVVPRKRLL